MDGLLIFDLNRLSELSEEEQIFVICNGSYHCFRCKMKSYRDVIYLMRHKYAHEYEIDTELRGVIKRFAGKEVIVKDDLEPDYFICGDDNFPFKEDMFK